MGHVCFHKVLLLVLGAVLPTAFLVARADAGWLSKIVPDNLQTASSDNLVSHLRGSQTLRTDSISVSSSPNPSTTASLGRSSISVEQRLATTMASLSNEFSGSAPMTTTVFVQEDLSSIQASTTAGPGDMKYFVWTHHKTGTFLMNHISKSIASALGGGRAKSGAGWAHSTNVKMLHGCKFSEKVMMLQNLNEEELNEIQRDCPHYRAVHLVRDPLKLLASGFIYHSWSSDTAGMPTGPRKLKNLTAEEGLRVEARAELDEKRGTLPEMQHVYDLLKGQDNVLTVRMEDIQKNYDESMQALFRHLLGPGHEAMVDKLVASAAAEDTNRWDAAHLNKDKHVASSVQKKEVKEVLAKLIDESDLDIMRVKAMREPMGYV